MTEPTLDQEAAAKDLVRQGYDIGRVGVLTGIDHAWLEEHWNMLTYVAPKPKSKSWGASHSQRRRTWKGR